MGTLVHDIRYALRQLRRNPGFTAVAALSLALGIGVNTAVFSMTNGILYKSLPVRDPHQLRMIAWTCDAVHNNPKRMLELEEGYSFTKSGSRYYGCFPHFAYRDFARQVQGFSDLFAFSNGGHSVTINIGGVPISASAQMVSGNFFQGYGAPVLIGRPIAPEDDRPDAAPVAVLTYRLWQRVFGLDPQVIGQALTVGETGFTIIGVLPRRYVGPTAGERRTDFYVPLMAQKQLVRERWLERDSAWWVCVMGRLAPGADEARIQASLEPLFRQVVDRSGALIDRPGISLQKGRYGVLSNERSELGAIFWGLQSVVGLVLLIACTNLAGLLLARGAVRQQEMAVRAALGAGRWRLIRQSLTESLILSLGGVGLGLLLSLWIRGIVSGFVLDPSSQRHFDLQIDAHVLMFALAVGVVTALLSGLFPALRAGHTDPSAGLKESGSRSAPRLRLGKVLVTAQMGMSVLFVVVGGLLCRTLINLSRADPGFDTENLLLVPIDPDRSLSPPKDSPIFLDSVRRQIAGIPGVRAVALSNATLTSGSGGWNPDILIPGRPEARPREALGLSVSEGYFATVGINLLQGRDFLATDTAKSQYVVIVNEEFARVFFPQENPLGQFIAATVGGNQYEEYQIVGVCSNHKWGSLRRGISPMYYRPCSQYETSTICLVRSVLPPLSLIPAVRRAVADLDRSLVLEGITTQKLAIQESLRPQRLVTCLFGSFALLALALCCIGLYGLMAYNVARRSGEMGIRKALGARPWDVAWPVLREALILTVVGVAIGLPVALALVRVVRHFLYEVEPHDPATVIGTIGIMVAVAVVAAWVPARRAAKVDPMVALRYE
jgi:predicted permease